MLDREIADHDHEFEAVARRDHPELGGATVEEECVNCDCWRARWVESPTLADFAGGGRCV